MLTLVRRIARERGATVLLSTHLLGEVEEICSRVLILNRGQVAAEGTVAEVSRQAAAPQSARLRVEADSVSEAHRILAAERGISAVELADGQPGTLALTLEDQQDTTPMNGALCALAEGGVPVLFFELEGARLSDAFLAMTESS